MNHQPFTNCVCAQLDSWHTVGLFFFKGDYRWKQWSAMDENIANDSSESCTTSSVCFESLSWTLNKDQRGLCARTVAVTCSLMPESVWALRPVDLCCYLQLRVVRVTLVNTVPPIQIKFNSIPTELSIIFKMMLVLFSCMQPFNVPTTVYVLYGLYFWTLCNEGRGGVTDWGPGGLRGSLAADEHVYHMPAHKADSRLPRNSDEWGQQVQTSQLSNQVAAHLEMAAQSQSGTLILPHPRLVRPTLVDTLLVLFNMPNENWSLFLG